MSKELKVLSLVSYKFLPPDMGGQKGIAFFNRYLSRELNLTCVTIKDNQASQGEGYPVKNVLSNHQLRYINPFIFFTLRRIIKQENITHLIIEHPYYGWLGMLLKWFCKVKLIVHSHNIESLRFKTMNKWWWGILWHYEKLTHKKADHSFFIQDNDKNYAIENFKLGPGQCTAITYGFELNAPPSSLEKKSSKEQICKMHQVSETDKILLFNGTLGYKPNLDALEIILDKINPLLLANKDFRYKIIVCGNKLPPGYKGLVDYKEKNIIYAGFVDDINLYFKGCDIFINPVIDGGGIKTKVVEALGYNLSVVSTKSGAIGIPSDVTGGKIKIINDEDWEAFAVEITEMNIEQKTPDAFFDHFFWGNIALTAKKAISDTV
jgi:hypothetical protein